MAALPESYPDELRAAQKLEGLVVNAAQTLLGSDIWVTREGTTFTIRHKDSDTATGQLQIRRLHRDKPEEGLGLRIRRLVRDNNTRSWIAFATAVTLLVLVGTEVRRRSRDA